MRFRLILLCAALLAFGGALWAPFQYDDFVLLNDAAASAPDGWKQAFTAAQTRPLTYLTEWLHLQVSHAPWSFHLVNLLLHLAAVWLAAGALEELLPAQAARIGAALFAFHPLQTEAVVYAHARATLLAALLCLAALRLWQKDRKWPAASVFVLALLANVEVSAFPLFLALLEWSTRRRREAWPVLAAMTWASAAAGIRVAYAGSQAGIVSFSYFSYQGVAILRYLWLLMVPWQLNVDAEVRVQPLAASIAWGVVALLVYRACRMALGARPGLWMLGGLLLLAPSSSIFPTQDLAADRRMYLPMLCFGALAGLLLRKANPRLLVGLGALYLAVSIMQTRVWLSPQALWMESARLSPDKVLPKRQLARVVSPQQAVELMQQAKQLAPGDPDVASDLGLAYLRLDKPELALPEFSRALALDPCHFEALWNLRKIGDSRLAPAACRYSPEQEGLLRAPPTSAK